MGLGSLIHFVWGFLSYILYGRGDSTFFLLKSGPSSGTGKAPIAELSRAFDLCLGTRVEVLLYYEFHNN